MSRTFFRKRTGGDGRDGARPSQGGGGHAGRVTLPDESLTENAVIGSEGNALNKAQDGRAVSTTGAHRSVQTDRQTYHSGGGVERHATIFDDTDVRRAPEAIELFEGCEPPKATAQQKGAYVVGGKVRFFKKAKVRIAEDFLAFLLRPHVPEAPFTGPVALEARWTFPYRKSERKATVRAGLEVPHTSRPDLDNLEKNLLDVMTRLRFWEDDSQVADKRTSKCWGPRPGIWVRVRPASEAT